MLHALESAEGQPTQERSDIAQAVTLLAARLKRRGLIVLVSDMLNDAEKTLAALKLLKFQQHDVLVLHVLDRTEVDFKFDRATRFVGLEGYPSIAADPRFVGGLIAKLCSSSSIRSVPAANTWEWITICWSPTSR